MSLIPLRSISGSLPMLFIEARMHGHPDTVFAQFGFSLDTDQYSIALFTKTSGVLFVAGVGSYMAYRIFARLLGRDFIWTIAHQARVDLLSPDVRLLHSANIYEGTEKDDAHYSIYADGEYSDSTSEGRCSTKTKNTFLSPETSLRRRRRLVCCSSRDRMLPSCSTPVENKADAEFTIKDDDDSLKIRNDSSERYRIFKRRLSVRAESVASRGLSQMSVTPSERSASLLLVWDDPHWDPQFEFPDDVVRRGQSPSPSNISEMSEFREAKNIFGDASSIKIDEEEPTRNSGQEVTVERVVTSESISDTHEFIQRSCMTDSKHLYRIVAECATNSDAVSLCSARSAGSFLSLRQRAATNNVSCGLLDLSAGCSKQRRLDAEIFLNSMTDSGISKGTASTLNIRSAQRSAMFDSAIGTDFVCSEDEVTPVAASVGDQTSRPVSCIIRRAELNLISEDQRSISLSEQSLEWFTEEFGRDEDASLPDESSIVHLGVTEPECSLLATARLRSSGTRDLMVWAREQFPPESPQLKCLQSLYLSKRRLKRVGVIRNPNSCEHFLASVLHSMLYHSLPIFPCSASFESVSEAVTAAFARYDFLKQWNFSVNSVDLCSSSKESSLNKASFAIDILRCLWDTQHAISEDNLVNEACCIEGLRLMTVLRVIDAFERSESSHLPPRALYSRLFSESNPRQTTQLINENQLFEREPSLLADTLRVRFEIFNCSRVTCGSWPSRNVYPDANIRLPTLNFLKLDSFIYPLYYVPD